MNPVYTLFQMDSPDCFAVALTEPDRESSIVYLCTHESGKVVPENSAKIRITNGEYQLTFIDPVSLNTLKTTQLSSNSLRRLIDLTIPAFTDDLVVKIERIKDLQRTIMKGTE
jgi:hypothetical protein